MLNNIFQSRNKSREIYGVVFGTQNSSCWLYVGCVLVTYKNSHKFTIILCSIKIRKTLENTRLSRVLNVRLFVRELSLAEFPYLFGDRRTLPKTLSKMTEMVLRFPLSFP